MKRKPPAASFNHSSFLVSPPVLLASLILGILLAFWGQLSLACVILFFFLLALAARSWAKMAAAKITLQITSSSMGLFPGEEAEVVVNIHNGKLLPVLWLELFFPLPVNLCLIPSDHRPPDDWEFIDLENQGFSTKMVGEKRLSFLLWHETAQLSLRWYANCRGVYSIDTWRMRTGDGFGLMQEERPLPAESVRRFVVYPRLISVAPDLFLRNLWNSDTGTQGVLEDPTIIRSTRDYQAYDSLKHINWRLAARGLPLTVNLYEQITPKSIHFIVDGESFSGPTPHLQELEDMLSILASELVALAGHQVQCGLSLCQGKNEAAINIFASENTEELLCALAAYQPLPDKRQGDEGEILPQIPAFDEPPLFAAAQRIGRFYYIAYDSTCLETRSLPHRLGCAQLSLLTYVPAVPLEEFEVICLQSLKEAKHG